MVNKVILVGNLGDEPESRETSGGMVVTNFSVATTFKGKGEKRTEWHRVVTFGKLAEICAKYMHKGKQVYIEGRLQTNEWTDKDGNRRWTTEIIADQTKMLGSKGDASPSGRTGYEAPAPKATPPRTDNDIPF